MVNKQALRLTSLAKGCQGGGAFSRHGTTALTPKETSVDGSGWETLLGQCVQPLQSALSSVASYSARQQHTVLSVWWTPVAKTILPHHTGTDLVLRSSLQ